MTTGPSRVERAELNGAQVTQGKAALLEGPIGSSARGTRSTSGTSGSRRWS